MADSEVDKELAKALQTAKKKPRNFAVIAKGSTVLKLIVDKKPIKADVVKEARKELGGNSVAKGVVSGDGGPELAFKVAEQPSFGDAKLRKYITDTTRLTLKVTIQVTPNLVEVNDDEQDESDGEEEGNSVSTPPNSSTMTPNSPESPPQQSATAPPAPPRGPLGRDQVLLAKRLQALKPDLEKVKTGDTSVTKEVIASIGPLTKLIQDGENGPAAILLDKVEGLVKQGLGELTVRAREAGDPATLFKDALKDIADDLKAAAGTPLAERAKLKASEAGVLARKGQFQEAMALLVEAENILDEDTEYFDALSGDEQEGEEADEDGDVFYDVPEWDESEQAEQARRQEAEAEQRAESIRELIDDIGTKNRQIEELGGAPVPTPWSTQFADATFPTENEFKDARSKLAGEQLAVEQALQRQKIAWEEQKNAKPRAVEVQKRIRELDHNNRLIVDVYGGQAVATPCADKYRGREELTKNEYEDALGNLGQEESAALARFEQLVQEEEQRNAAEAQKKLEDRQRAERVQREIMEVYAARRKLEQLSQDLEFDLSDRDGYDEIAEVELTQEEASGVTERLTQEGSALREGIDLLVQNAKWKPGELTDLEGEAKAARDNLVAELAKTEALDATAAKNWIAALNTHARLRRAELAMAALRIDMESFYDAQNPDSVKKPIRCTKTLMEAFATEYDYPTANWKTYQKCYKELALGKTAPAEAPPKNGMLALTKLRSTLPSGTTAGQWYTHDSSIEASDGNTYAYHLSVAFRVTRTKGKPDIATITKAHVSFKTGGTDYKYWYTIAKGKFSFESTSGGAPKNGELRNRANGLLSSKAPKLNAET